MLPSQQTGSNESEAKGRLTPTKDVVTVSPFAITMANGLTVTTSFVGVSLPLASLSLLPVCWLGSIEFKENYDKQKGRDQLYA
jgi:hypothetical protein